MVLLASVQSLGAIESKREAFSRSTFSFDYETIVKNVGKAIFGILSYTTKVYGRSRECHNKITQPILSIKSKMNLL